MSLSATWSLREDRSKWPSPAQPRCESCFVKNIKNCHSGFSWRLVQKPFISLCPALIRLISAQNPRRSAVILTSPAGSWWRDAGPAASPEVWRFVAHGAQRGWLCLSHRVYCFLSATYCRDAQIAGAGVSPPPLPLPLSGIYIISIAARLSLSWAQIHKSTSNFHKKYSICHGSCGATRRLRARTPRRSLQ